MLLNFTGVVMDMYANLYSVGVHYRNYFYACVNMS